MTADFRVVLDACVLVAMPLADTLLRMAETPRLYLPRWSDEILNEVSRTLVKKLNKSSFQAARRETAMREAFPEAWIDDGYQKLISLMTNHPKDRHVLAAAVHCKSQLIVTYNKSDFSTLALDPWQVQCIGPSTFLEHLYDLDRVAFANKLHQQAEDIGIDLRQLLDALGGNVPTFVKSIRNDLEP